ncbi:hypothetical protein LJY25_14595 [Hymenobacter sp. BT175]|uniref:hypothetical protein n=1 Tax=Hymenobacter translucens TaxID=2886507 RepID=UPI001D0F1210|nr:hypothetical protein [Hymenobacter translucens]MCC2547681.1 hypothetical protein [Hymenobacter translucens]
MNAALSLTTKAISDNILSLLNHPAGLFTQEERRQAMNYKLDHGTDLVRLERLRKRLAVLAAEREETLHGHHAMDNGYYDPADDY